MKCSERQIYRYRKQIWGSLKMGLGVRTDYEILTRDIFKGLRKCSKTPLWWWCKTLYVYKNQWIIHLKWINAMALNSTSIKLFLKRGQEVKKKRTKEQEQKNEYGEDFPYLCWIYWAWSEESYCCSYPWAGSCPDPSDRLAAYRQEVEYQLREENQTS